MAEKTDIHEVSTSFWQSPIWADILRKTRQAEVFFLPVAESKVLIERRKIWRNYTGLYVLGIASSLVTPELMEAIQQNIKQETDLFVQVEPLGEVQNTGDMPKGMSSNKIQNTGIVKSFLSTFYFLPSISHQAPFRRFIEPVTALLDLTIPEPELIASFAEKGRYNIRLAQKRGVITRWVHANQQTTNCKLQIDDSNNQSLKIVFESLRPGVYRREDGRPCLPAGRLKIEKTYIKCFYDLLDETTKRDGFAHNSLAYYKHFVETLESHNAGGLLVAEKDGVLHAAGIFAYWGDTAIYYYGASSSDTTIRRDMATYLLQWDAIREGIQRGCKTYDFLGISADGKGKLAGVTEFKLRFNPEKKHWPSERVIVFKPVTLFLLQCISRIRKIFK